MICVGFLLKTIDKSETGTEKVTCTSTRILEQDIIPLGNLRMKYMSTSKSAPSIQIF